jgi:two-component system, LytTR family, response regulator
MNCIIVDDDEASRNVMEHLVGQADFLKLVKICSDPVEALNVLNNEKIDLILLDIEMPNLNGLDLIKSIEKPPLSILATSRKNYALEAFDCNVVDYLVKPIAVERFFKAITKAKEIFEGSKHVTDHTNTDHIYIKTNSALHKISTKDLLWVEALGDYITMNVAGEKYIVHAKMKTVESKLPPDKFVRVHRSFIISIDHIHSIDDSIIIMEKKLIPIGAVYKDNLMKRLNLL